MAKWWDFIWSYNLINFTWHVNPPIYDFKDWSCVRTIVNPYQSYPRCQILYCNFVGFNLGPARTLSYPLRTFSSALCMLTDRVWRLDMAGKHVMTAAERKANAERVRQWRDRKRQDPEFRQKEAERSRVGLSVVKYNYILYLQSLHFSSNVPRFKLSLNIKHIFDEFVGKSEEAQESTEPRI